MSLHISHTSNFPQLTREGSINCNFEDKPKANVTLKQKEIVSSFQLYADQNGLHKGPICLPVRYISSPSVNIWWQRTHLAQVGW